jgi:hypothetical protein
MASAPRWLSANEHTKIGEIQNLEITTTVRILAFCAAENIRKFIGKRFFQPRLDLQISVHFWRSKDLHFFCLKYTLVDSVC